MPLRNYVVDARRCVLSPSEPFHQLLTWQVLTDCDVEPACDGILHEPSDRASRVGDERGLTASRSVGPTVGELGG